MSKTCDRDKGPDLLMCFPNTSHVCMDVLVGGDHVTLTEPEAAWLPRMLLLTQRAGWQRARWHDSPEAAGYCKYECDAVTQSNYSTKRLFRVCLSVPIVLLHTHACTGNENAFLDTWSLFLYLDDIFKSPKKMNNFLFSSYCSCSYLTLTWLCLWRILSLKLAV